MTVKELIKLLESCNPDDKVATEGCDCDAWADTIDNKIYKNCVFIKRSSNVFLEERI